MTKKTSDLIWQTCLARLEEELPPQHFNVWIRPLQFREEKGTWVFYAPNTFVKEWIDIEYLSLMNTILADVTGKTLPVEIRIGAMPKEEENEGSVASQEDKQEKIAASKNKRLQGNSIPLNDGFTFENFVSGKSNQLAFAAAKQIAEMPGESYNPLFIYGAVGLGKTHLMQSVGNTILKKNPEAKIVYLSSERYVSAMVRAIQTNTMEQFKETHRSCDILLIDDIQFLAGKERSQEEFFHTFNELLEGRQQMIFTCDRYPKEIDGLEDRLKSRFGWGLTVAVEPPELETRVAILIHKAHLANLQLSEEIAFFIGKRMRSNVRELEGALKRLIAHVHFTGQEVTLDVVKEALKDLIALQERQVTISNIQKTVAEYYKIRTADIMAARRTRLVARPRQLAMALAKELTHHSLPEIGAAFGGRDHTTVLHACRKIKELLSSDKQLAEDFSNLMRTLAG